MHGLKKCTMAFNKVCLCKNFRLICRGLQSVCRCGVQVQKRRKQASAWRQKELGYNAKDQRLVLATEDVAEALKEVSRCSQEGLAPSGVRQHDISALTYWGFTSGLCALQLGVNVTAPAYFANGQKQ
jgi:hypothetical protein